MPHSVKCAVATATPNHSSESASPTRKRRKLGLGSPLVCIGETVPGCGNQGTHGPSPGRVSGGLSVMRNGTYGQTVGEPDQLYIDTRPRDLLMFEAQINNSQEASRNPLPNTVCLQTQAIIVSVPAIPNSHTGLPSIAETSHPAPLSKVSVETRHTQNTAKNIDDADDGDVPMDLESPVRSPQYHPPGPELRQHLTRAGNINHGSITAQQVSGPSAQSQSTARSVDLVRDEGAEEEMDSPPYSPRLDELPGSPVGGITTATSSTIAELPMAGSTTQTGSVTPSLLSQQLAQHQDLQTPPLLSRPPPLATPQTSLQTLLSLVPTTTFPCANCGALWPMFVGATRQDGRNYWYAHSDIF